MFCCVKWLQSCC